MTPELAGEFEYSKSDQLALERAVRGLCTARIREPLTFERVKTWVKQFDTEAGKTLAWLILRHLVYRTNVQLESSLRQALKLASQHFLSSSGLSSSTDWRGALSGEQTQLQFTCGPPTVNDFTVPRKSGEVITRALSRAYKMGKSYPFNTTNQSPDDRYLVVDDGTYTGHQIVEFFENWQVVNGEGKIAVVVGLAHTEAVNAMKDRFPSIPLFYGELLTEKNGLRFLSESWVRDKQWPISGPRPIDVYLDICVRKGPFSSAPEGFGSLGLMIAFEHGIPDDSLQLLWDRSPSWVPLIER